LTAGSVTSAEYEGLDAKTYRAINGDDGGTWAPSSQIVIGGAGLDVTGPSSFGDCRAFAMGAAGSFVIDPGANVDLYANVTVDGGAHSYIGTTVTLSAGSVIALTDLSQLTLDADSDMTCAGSISMTGTSTFNVGSGCTMTVQSGGAAVCASGGTFTVQSGGQLDVALGGIIDVEGKLRVDGQVRTGLNVAGVNSNFLTNNDDPGYIVSVTDGSVHTITCHIASTPPEQGQLMFIRVDLTNAGSGVNVGNEGGPAGGIAVFGTGTGRGGLILQYNNIAGSWRVLSGWGTNLAYGAAG
jgi:hypothetical protein